MCGRFTIATPVPELEERFGVRLAGLAVEPRYNLAPTESALALTTEGPRMLRWGLVPRGARDARVGNRMINARVETVLTRGAFRALAERASRRALIPADGWYEWLRAEDPRRPRQPFRFTVDGGGPFAFAGLWTTADVGGEQLATFTIITGPASPVGAAVHDRMPVVLAGPAEERAWLDPVLDGASARDLCRPLADARLTVRPANPRVGRAGPDNDDPGLLVAPEPASLF